MSERATELMQGLKPIDAILALDTELASPTSVAGYTDDLNQWYRERPMYEPLLLVAGLTDHPDLITPTSDYIRYEHKIAFFKGALLGFRAVELHGFGWVLNELEPDAIVPTDTLECGPISETDDNFWTPELEQRSNEGYHMVRPIHSKIHSWGISATSNMTTSTTFGRGLGFSLQTSSQAIETRREEIGAQLDAGFAELVRRSGIQVDADFLETLYLRDTE